MAILAPVSLSKIEKDSNLITFDPIFVYKAMRGYLIAFLVALIAPLPFAELAARNGLSPTTGSFLVGVTIATLWFFLFPFLYFLDFLSSQRKNKVKRLIRTIILILFSLISTMAFAYAYYMAIQHYYPYDASDVISFSLFESAVALLVLLIFHGFGRFFKLAPPLRDIFVGGNPSSNGFKTQESGGEYSYQKKGVPLGIEDNKTERPQTSEGIDRNKGSDARAMEHTPKSTTYALPNTKGNEISFATKAQSMESPLSKVNPSSYGYIKNLFVSDVASVSRPSYIPIPQEKISHSSLDDPKAGQGQATRNNYSPETLLNMLFVWNDWLVVVLFYYFFFGAFLTLLFVLTLVFPFDVLTDVNFIGLFDYVNIFPFGMAIAYIFFRYYQEKPKNRALARDLNALRGLIYFAAAFSNVILTDLVRLSFGRLHSVLPILVVWSLPLASYLLFILWRDNRTTGRRTFTSLMKNSLALNLGKYYLFTRLPAIKSTLVDSNPLNVDSRFKESILENLRDLSYSFESSGFNNLSQEGIVLFLMKVGEPLREGIREALGRNLTSVLADLDGETPKKSSDVDELWRSIDKAFLRWESSLQVT